MKLVLIGAPGSGKGTLASKLINELNIPTISTGDLLRRNVKEGTPLGLEAKAYMDAGQLVPTELVNKLLEIRLQEKDTKDGFILDGYPRTVEQAEILNGITNMDLCLYLDVPKDEIVKRLSGRITCKDCGQIYNSQTYTEEKCKCGGELYVRDDDKPETIEKRFVAYENQTKPVINYYKDQGILITVKGQESPEETFKVALEKINDYIENCERN